MNSEVIDMIDERLSWLQQEQDDCLTEFGKHGKDETLQDLISTAHLYMQMEFKFLNKLKQKIQQ